MSSVHLSTSGSMLKEQFSRVFESVNSPLTWSLLLLGALLVGYQALSFGTDGTGIPRKWDLPLVGSWAFFTRRYDFCMNNLKRMGGMFQFTILQHRVVVLQGEKQRNFFLNQRELHFMDGYSILMGGGPTLKETDETTVHNGVEDLPWFAKRITTVLSRERLDRLLPKLFNDMNCLMASWSSTGKFDPFEDIYNIIFQLTLRAGACNEIADNPDRVRDVNNLYWTIERSSTPATVLMPWLPSKARKAKENANIGFFIILKTIIDERRQTGRREDDAVQYLIDEDDGTNDIVQFVMANLFAGVINTGMMGAWVLLHLAVNPDWKARVLAELHDLLDKHVAKDDSPLYERLGSLPTSVWDEGLPTLELCLKETMRLIVSGIILRRNNGRDLSLGGKVIKRGTFLAYPIGDVHLDPRVYTNPSKFDPMRFGPGREEDKKQYAAFVGWGMGRHPCLGIRFAKLEIKTLLALFLSTFEYDIVDPSGNVVRKIPEPDRNNVYKSPPSRPVYIRYKRLR